MIRSGATSLLAVDVFHYVAGGREHGGGIGRLVGYILDSCRQRDRQKVIDTRGGPRWRAVRSTIVLGGAIATMVAARVMAPEAIHQLHIAGRGSTARKLVLSAVARRIGCRHILHLHDYDYAEDYRRRPRWLQAAIRKMFRDADAVIVLGKRDRETVTEILAVPADRVHILRNCVPDPGRRPEHSPANVRSVGDAFGERAKTEPVRIIFMGQLGPRKGVPELLAALARPEMSALAAGSTAWNAVLAGDGTVEEYRAKADALGLSDRVTLTGWLNEADTRALCRSASILVLPSHAEGMAMAVVEGLANGLAVVTTRVGAHDELLTDDVNCAFVPAGDPAAIAATLARLVTHPLDRARLGKAGRSLFLREFEIAGYMCRLDHVLAGVRSSSIAELGPA